MNDTQNPYKPGTLNAGLWNATHSTDTQTLAATPMTDMLISLGWIGAPIELARKMERDRAALIAALERITRVASVELTGKRDDVLEQARATLAQVQS